jgi:hypothetical protein
VLLKAEYAGGVTTDPLEDRGTIVDDVTHHVDLGLVPGNELSVVPNVRGGLDRHVCSSCGNFIIASVKAANPERSPVFRAIRKRFVMSMGE